MPTKVLQASAGATPSGGLCCQLSGSIFSVHLLLHCHMLLRKTTQSPCPAHSPRPLTSVPLSAPAHGKRRASLDVPCLFYMN